MRCAAVASLHPSNPPHLIASLRRVLIRVYLETSFPVRLLYLARARPPLQPQYLVVRIASLGGREDAPYQLGLVGAPASPNVTGRTALLPGPSCGRLARPPPRALPVAAHLALLPPAPVCHCRDTGERVETERLLEPFNCLRVVGGFHRGFCNVAALLGLLLIFLLEEVTRRDGEFQRRGGGFGRRGVRWRYNNGASWIL